MLEFQWDESKNRENVRKHGVDFLRASLVFEGPILERPDDRFDYGEERMIALGLASGTVYRVVYVMRANLVRIISAQKANKHEQVIYYRSVHG